MLVCFCELSFAHTLLHQHASSDGATVVYLDEVSRKLIVRKYHSTDSKIPANFPKNIRSLSSFNPSIFDKYQGVSSSESIVDLNSSSSAISSALSRAVDDSSSKFRIERTMNELKKNLEGKSSYKVVADTKRHGKRNIALFNPVSSHFIIQKSKYSNAEVSSPVSFPKDLARRFRESDQDSYDLSTPHKIDKYRSRIQKGLKNARVSEDVIAKTLREIDELKKSKSEIISKMKLIKTVGESGEQKEIYMDLDTGDFYFRKFDDGKVDKDSFFNVGDDATLESLKELLIKEDLYNEGEFEQKFTDFFSNHCPENQAADVIDNYENIEDILNVNSQVWEQYLSMAVSDGPLILEDGSLVSKLSYQGQEHGVKFKLDRLGNIESVSFINSDKATQSGLSIERVKEGNEYIFKIVSNDNGEKLDQFFFDTEAVKLDSDPITAKLAIYVLGSHEKDPLGKNYYDKNIYPIELDGLGKITNSGKKIHLSSARSSKYPHRFKEGDGAGVTSFFFSNFFSTNGRREKLENEISKEALNTSEKLNKDGVVLLNKGEVKETVSLIVSEVERDIPKLKGSVPQITAKVYEHAYEKFSKIIVPKMIKDMMPGEKQDIYESITDKAMVEFKQCLKRASDQSNPEGAPKCMESFEKEAPVIIGQEILDLQLSQNGYEQLSAKAKLEYTKCIKENYDTAKGDINFIKGCIFKATFSSVDDGLEGVISLTLEKMSKEMDPTGKKTISVSSNISLASRNALRSCYSKKGYLSSRVFTDSYNMDTLKELEVETFKQDLFTCAASVEEIVTSNVTEQFIRDNLAEIDLPENKRAEILSLSMDKGLKHCVDIQKRRVDILAKSGKFSVVKASECKDYVTLFVTEQVVDQSLQEKVSKDLWNKIGKDAPHKSCFEGLKQNSLKNLLEESESEFNIDQQSANCLKKSIEWITYYVAKEELLKTFSDDPMYKKVKIDDKKRDQYAKRIQKCISEKLSSKNSLEEVTDSLSQAQDACIVSLVLSDDAAKDILSPVVSTMLDENDIGIDLQAKAIGPIVHNMRERVNSRLKTESLTLDQVVDEFKKVKGTAIYFIADMTIDGYVNDFIDDKSKVDEISLKVRKDLFDGEDGYRAILTGEKDEAKFDNHIRSLTKDAAIKLTAIVTNEEAKKLLSTGVLKSEAEVEKLSKNAPITMEKCLNEFKTGEFSDHVTYCIAHTKASLTKDVFEDQLKSVLYNSEYSEYFDEKTRKEILDKQINPQLESSIKEAYKKDELESFIEDFTLSSTIIASKPVLRGIIAETIYGKGVDPKNAPASKVELVEMASQKSEEVLSNCLLENQRAGKKSSQDTELCINGVKLTATSLILESILDDVGTYFDKDPISRKKLIDGQVKYLELCAKSANVEFKGNEFSNHLNSCLIEDIFDFTGNAVKHLSHKNELMRTIGDNDLEKMNTCIQDAKRDYVKSQKVVSLSAQQRNELYSKIKDGVGFWNEIFSIHEQSGIKNSSKGVIDWSVETVKRCATKEVTPLVLDSILLSRTGKKAMGVTSHEHALVLEISRAIKDFTGKEFDDRFWIDFSSAFSTDSKKAEPSVNDRKDISDYINSIMPILGTYIKKLSAFDSKRTVEEFRELLKEIALAKKNKNLTLDELKDILLSSKLMDTIITSEIGEVIRKEATVALSSEGLTADDIRKIVSPKILNELFSPKNPKAKKVLDDIKQQYIRPLLDGKKVDGIPESVVKDVKIHLASDTKMGGFVETLAGAIVQKKLDAKRPNNVGTQTIAGLIGYNHRDFDWNNLRQRRATGVASKDQPVQKAIDYFGASVLKPILLKENLGNHVENGIFSNKVTPIIEKRKESFSEMIEGLMELDRP
ncbi:hypothetical protein [Halobacteriovorax sp. HLS]|uniref:hypothetical protein n=1 Tax=Halobacteriovorax sp. HLS TaxID=2234000 RepID=UPI000FD8847F|nr:hypothetical protein [Halobacteriovorax sp. HLS]